MNNTLNILKNLFDPPCNLLQSADPYPWCNSTLVSGYQQCSQNSLLHLILPKIHQKIITPLLELASPLSLNSLPGINHQRSPLVAQLHKFPYRKDDHPDPSETEPFVRSRTSSRLPIKLSVSKRLKHLIEMPPPDVECPPDSGRRLFVRFNPDRLPK